MLIAAFSILGIAIGASLQYIFSRFLEERKQTRLLESSAYADFLRGVAEAAHLNLGIDSDQVHARIAEAKARICLYGSPEVISLMAEFERKGGAIITGEQIQAFVCLIQAMRGDERVADTELRLVLVGSERSEANSQPNGPNRF